MRAHCLQHVAFEGLGSIAPWLENAGYDITFTRFFESPVLPRLEEIDFLVAMGGPMSVHDELDHPWLVQEKAFIRSAVRARKPLLGVCLGAQLIAAATGGRVYPNPCREIGWFPVRAIPPAGELPLAVFRFPPEAEVFHWHGETFDLPPGAVHLAGSEACRNQAFQLGPSAIGLQFHLETTPESMREIMANCREELVPSAYVQSEAVLLATPADRFKIANGLMGGVLSFLDAHRGRAQG
jgi:GMP synthase-like glutamine amidotransferase